MCLVLWVPFSSKRRMLVFEQNKRKGMISKLLLIISCSMRPSYTTTGEKGQREAENKDLTCW